MRRDEHREVLSRLDIIVRDWMAGPTTRLTFVPGCDKLTDRCIRRIFSISRGMWDKLPICSTCLPQSIERILLDLPGSRARIEATRMFDWDEGNIDKNLKHGVQDWEIEEACQDPRSRIIGYRLVKGEWRYVLLGRSVTSGKYLRVVYTLRTALDGETLIRPISVVEMSAAQRRRYLRK